MRIQLTSTTRLFLLMLLTMQSEMTQESTGSASQSTSTESSVVSHLLERNSGDCVERDTLTTSNVLLAGQTGRGTIPSRGGPTLMSGGTLACEILYISPNLEICPPKLLKMSPQNSLAKKFFNKLSHHFFFFYSCYLQFTEGEFKHPSPKCFKISFSVHQLDLGV
jgi:hypothetical protein